MTKPLISVIIPCYKVEDYIEKCVDSVLNQSYKKLEIILVDDGSPDKVPKLCDGYAKKDERVKVIHKKNGGLSSARNAGLEIATGDYISFIDSDDYINKEYYELMVKSVLDNKSDISIADINVVFNTHDELSKCYVDKFNVLNVINTPYAAAAWNKLYKKEIFEYRYQEGKINEDIAVTIPLLVNNKISYAKGALYNYVQRDNSIQNKEFKDNRFDIIDGVDLALERIEGIKDYETIESSLVFNQIITLFLYVIPKITDKNKRLKVLYKYYELTKKYGLYNNEELIKFISNQGSIHKVYYKTLFKALDKGNINKVNNTIQLYRNIKRRGDQ